MLDVRIISGGSTYYLLATIADNSTTIYTDNIADASLGAGSNGTGRAVARLSSDRKSVV